MTWKALDWKFFATIVFTIAGLVIPVFIWQVDLASHSLTLRLVSTSPLQPVSNIQNLQISLNGQNIESPYLSTLELVNTGSKPVLSSDFDTPLEIFVKGGAKLISAETSNTTPKNIPVKIGNAEHGASVSPFLSNPKDSITISVITSGPAPEFEPRARIAGINEVGYEDTSREKTSHLKTAANLMVTTGLIFLYFIFLPTGLRGQRFNVPRGLAIVTGTLSAFAAIATARPAFEFVDAWPYAGVWKFVIPFTSYVFLAYFALRYTMALRRKGHIAPFRQ
ncbi:hypothetical protein [Pseudomonas sp. Root562]|uniref:hypothetical protein n=1 Tax=Pseudomonas sp. Root562 TaxID=1736561 RepID=UPI000703A72E|nr:hypothetical protein [Pseudomonas sp. Root562]KQZ94578.1 hypothetical protein ASD60_00845 [Pseudomonas sp. Root562]